MIFRNLFILIIVFLPSCNRNDLALLKVTELGSAKISDSALVNILQNETIRSIEIEYSLSEDTALKRLRDKEIDLAIIPNNTVIDINDLEVRTIAPLLPRMLLILGYKIGNVNEKSLKELLENNTLIFEEQSRVDSIFFEKLYNSFGVNRKNIMGVSTSKFDLDRYKDSSFVFIGLTHLHNPLMLKLVEKGAVFYSLDKVSNLNSGSAVEGFTMEYPSAYPFIFPKAYYKGKPEHPVLTIAILDILVCRSDMDQNMVYNISKDLVGKKSQLIQIDNMYSMLQIDFKNHNFSFPIHEGTLSFINRDKPPIWSRYASLIWPIVSMLAIFLGLFASLKRRLKQRQKHRIETYYGALLRIRKTALKDKEKPKELIKSLEKIRADAFDALSEDKLVANESFNIFLSLYGDIRKELTNHLTN